MDALLAEVDRLKAAAAAAAAAEAAAAGRDMTAKQVRHRGAGEGGGLHRNLGEREAPGMQHVSVAGNKGGG